MSRHFRAGARILDGLALQAGLSDVRMSAAVEDLDICYPGSRHFEFRYNSLRKYLGAWPDWLARWGVKSRLSDETRLAALQELDAWHNHPHAFLMLSEICAAGRVE